MSRSAIQPKVELRLRTLASESRASELSLFAPVFHRQGLEAGLSDLKWSERELELGALQIRKIVSFIETDSPTDRSMDCKIRENGYDHGCYSPNEV